MNVVNFSMRFDSDVKGELDSVLAGYGLTTTAFFRLMTNQIIQTKKLPLNFEFLAEESPRNLTLKAVEDARAGRLHRVANKEELLKAIME